MLTTTPTLPRLHVGDFVRVKQTSDTRAGQDGLVVAAEDGQRVGLVFGYNRYNQSPEKVGVVATFLTEEWLLEELDLTTVCH